MTDLTLPTIRLATAEDTDGGYQVRLDLDWPEHPEIHMGVATLGLVGIADSLPLVYPSRRHAEALASALNTIPKTPG